MLVEHGVVAGLLCSALAMALLVARWGYAGRPHFLFLAWNLFLAWIPWVAAVPLRAHRSSTWRGWKLVPLFCVWLAFLPNAPYLVTDLLHLRPRAGAPLWFDATLLFVFAWTGCLLGFSSLAAVHGRIEAWAGRAAGWSFVVAVSLLCGFGIYLGRFPRWNSWDVLTRPAQLLRAVIAPVLDPPAHPTTYAVTVVFGSLMMAGYAAFAGMRKRGQATFREGEK